MTQTTVVPDKTQYVAVGADPATVAGRVSVYSKLVVGVAQLFMKAGDGTVTQVGGGGGGGTSIGGAVTSGTPGSLLFVGTGPVLAQDNANLFWDNTNKRLGLGTAAAPGYTLDVRNAGASQLHIANGNVDSGGYLTSTVASQLFMSGGLGFDGTNLRAKAATASVVELINGSLSFQTGTGLTIGAIAALTQRMTISSAGIVAVEGAGLISRQSSNAAGFFDTALFSAGTGGSFTQADRELRVTGGGNAGGQRYQYLTFNGRWSGNIDSPTLTQGLYDRTCGIEFDAAADSLGPNPNASMNFFVNTGTKSTGSELVVTPTRAMTITYTARIGVGTTNPSQPFDVETILGNTNAKFGSAFPVYVVSNNPNIGFNAYYNGAWKFGKGSTAHYACTMGFDPTTPVWSLGITQVTGAADATATPTTRLSVSATGVVTVSGLASTTIDAIVLSQASSGALRIQDPTSPGFGYDYTNHRLTINTHPVIMFASVDVTNPTANMISLRNTQAYSSTSGSLIYLAGDLVPSASGHRLGGLTFGGWSGGGAFYREGASVQSFAEGAWTAGTTHPSYLSLSTTPSGGTVALERVRIAASGLVTINGIAATNTFVITTGNMSIVNGQAAISRDHATDGPLFLQGTNAGNANPSAIGFLNQAGSFRSYFGYFPSSYAFTYLRTKNGIFCQSGEDLVIADATNSTMVVNHSSRFIGIGAGLTSPLYSLDVRGSTTASRIHFGFSTTDDGGYLVSAQASQAAMAGGMSYNGTQFIAKAAQVGAFDIVLGEFLWYNNTGQTIGAAASAPVRMKLYAAGGLEIGNSDSATVSASGFGKIRYTTSGQKFQVSMNGGAYVDLATGSTTIGVERLSADGAASPTLDVTYVSGTGTDLTLANGSTDGFQKVFIVTSGSGTITPANLADGDVLTWTASPANVCFRWDATGVTWHVVGSPYNMVTT